MIRAYTFNKMFNIDSKLKKVLGHFPNNTPKSSFSMGKLPSSSRIFSSNVVKNFNLKSIGGKNDFDFDGVSNKKDCQPRNTMRQDRVKYQQALNFLGRTNLKPFNYNIKETKNTRTIEFNEVKDKEKRFGFVFDKLRGLSDKQRHFSDSKWNPNKDSPWEDRSKHRFVFTDVKEPLPGTTVKVAGTKHKYATVMSSKPYTQEVIGKAVSNLGRLENQHTNIKESDIRKSGGPVLVKTESGRYKHYPLSRIEEMKGRKPLPGQDKDYRSVIPGQDKDYRSVIPGSSYAIDSDLKDNLSYGVAVGSKPGVKYMSVEGEYDLKKIPDYSSRDFTQMRRLTNIPKIIKSPNQYNFINRSKFSPGTLYTGYTSSLGGGNEQRTMELEKIKMYPGQPHKGKATFIIEETPSGQMPYKSKTEYGMEVLKPGWVNPGPKSFAVLKEESEKLKLKTGSVVPHEGKPYTVRGVYKKPYTSSSWSGTSQYEGNDQLVIWPLKEDNYADRKTISEYGVDKSKPKEEFRDRRETEYMEQQEFDTNQRISDTSGKLGTVMNLKDGGYEVLWDSGEFSSGWKRDQLLEEGKIRKQKYDEIALASVDKEGEVKDFEEVSENKDLIEDEDNNVTDNLLGDDDGDGNPNITDPNSDDSEDDKK